MQTAIVESGQIHNVREEGENVEEREGRREGERERKRADERKERASERSLYPPGPR